MRETHQGGIEGKLKRISTGSARKSGVRSQSSLAFLGVFQDYETTRQPYLRVLSFSFMWMWRSSFQTRPNRIMQVYRVSRALHPH